MESKQINPLQNLFSDIKKILDFIEIKDKPKADAAETSASRNQSELWVNAKLNKDTYITYAFLWRYEWFTEISPNVSNQNIRYWMEHPLNVPLIYRDNLYKRGKEAFLNSYVEENEYYRMLNGLPPLKYNKNQWIKLSEKVRNKLHVNTDDYIHNLHPLIQNRYMDTDEYKETLMSHPDDTYLKYLGIYKIDPFVSRHAKDFEIIRYPSNRPDINPNLLKQFYQIYNDYRDYVMITLYNRQFENLYENYRNFMGLIIMMMTLYQICNKSVESISSKNFLDDSVLHIILSMYGIPDNILLTNEVRRRLVIEMQQLIKEKGTKDVYYHLVDILGYEDVKISKLMLMKNTDESNSDPAYFLEVDLKDKDPYESIKNGKARRLSYHDVIDKDPRWWDDENSRKVLNDAAYSIADSQYINIETTTRQLQYEFETIFFPKLILDNKSYAENFLFSIPELLGTEQISIFDAIIYIIACACRMFGQKSDQGWNNKFPYLSGNILSPELTEVYKYGNQLYSDLKKENPIIPKIGKKYIDVKTNKVYLYEKDIKDYPNENVEPSFIEVTTSTFIDKMYAAAGFNFDLDLDNLEEYLHQPNIFKYISNDVSKIEKFIENFSMADKSDINRIYNSIIIPMRDWLIHKMNTCIDRHTFAIYENIYRAFYTHDANDNKIVIDYKNTLDLINEKYSLSKNNLYDALRYYYPCDKIEDKYVAVTKEDYISTSLKYASTGNKLSNKYLYEFDCNYQETISAGTKGIPWYITFNTGYWNGTEFEPNGGREVTLYFFDILNCDDCRKLGDGQIFGRYDDKNRWVMDPYAVANAVAQVNMYPNNALENAQYQWSRFVSKDQKYESSRYLDSTLRNTEGLYKDIINDKIMMDSKGYNEAPETYENYLERYCPSLYYKFFYTTYDDINYNILPLKTLVNNVLIVINALELALDIHTKYLNQYAVGQELFFKPLKTLIERFKSTYITINEFGMKYLFDDRIDLGGNSNMLKLFDEVNFIIHFVMLSDTSFNSPLQLYDAEYKAIHKILLMDRAQEIKMVYGEGFAAEERTTTMGSMRMQDAVKCFINGKEIDNGQPSHWWNGEPGTGLYSEEDDVLMRIRKGTARITSLPVDLDGWKEFQEPAM